VPDDQEGVDVEGALGQVDQVGPVVRLHARGG
jgi:hypothetical protein